MDLVLNNLCDTAEELIKPYNDLCAYKINQSVNRFLYIKTSLGTTAESFDAIAAMIRDSKIAVVMVLCPPAQEKYIRERMRERLFTEIKVDFHSYPKALYFGQFNFGLVIDI